jgi:hypothetical protein
MTDYITLMGAEQVASAAGRMVSAADDMRRAAGSIDDAFQRHERFLDDWLMRFTDAIEKLAAGPRVLTVDGKDVLYVPPDDLTELKG